MRKLYPGTDCQNHWHLSLWSITSADAFERLGLVDIHVHHPLRTSTPLREELMQQFGLQDAQVLLSTPSDDLVLSRVGALAARYVDRRIQEGKLLQTSHCTLLASPGAQQRAANNSSDRRSVLQAALQYLDIIWH